LKSLKRQQLLLARLLMSFPNWGVFVLWESIGLTNKSLTLTGGITFPELVASYYAGYYFDPLVFPCATGDENYIGGAVETIESIHIIKEKITYVKTVLGISNISFGLPANAREVVNSVFLYYCTKAGLDLAIVNAEKLERFVSIPKEERRLAKALLFNCPPVNVPANHKDFALLETVPEDWREQSHDQKIAVNQFHIAAIAEYFRGAGKKEERC
jgi:5-methyltetrahydrofolate--homocysteine methyltransferase